MAGAVGAVVGLVLGACVVGLVARSYFKRKLENELAERGYRPAMTDAAQTNANSKEAATLTNAAVQLTKNPSFNVNADRQNPLRDAQDQV